MRTQAIVTMANPVMSVRYADNQLHSALARITALEAEVTRLRRQFVSEEQYIRIPHALATVYVAVSEILAVRAESNYSRIQLKNGKQYLASRTLKSWASELSEAEFVRCHKSFLLRKSEIAEIHRHTNRIVLRNGDCIPLSRRLYKNVVQRLLDPVSSGRLNTAAKPGYAVHKLTPKAGVATK